MSGKLNQIIKVKFEKEKIELHVEIEKDIPIPPPKAPKGKSKWDPIIDSMRSGNSVLLPARKYAHRLAGAMRHKKIKSSMRVLEDGRCRVWRKS